MQQGRKRSLMVQNKSALNSPHSSQVFMAGFRAVYAPRKGSADAIVDVPPVRRESGGGGGDMDDVLKRLASVESSVADIRAHVSGLAAAAQHFATKADVQGLKADVNGLEASIIKWIIGTVLTSVALAFAIAKFVS